MLKYVYLVADHDIVLHIPASLKKIDLKQKRKWWWWWQKKKCFMSGTLRSKKQRSLILLFVKTVQLQEGSLNFPWEFSLYIQGRRLNESCFLKVNGDF